MTKSSNENEEKLSWYICPKCKGEGRFVGLKCILDCEYCFGSGLSRSARWLGFISIPVIIYLVLKLVYFIDTIF